MYATQVEFITKARPTQPRVPIPLPEEGTPSAVEILAQALEDVGQPDKASRVRQHAQGNYWIDRCPDHDNCWPESDGQGLCPWCRWQKLKRWMTSLLEGREVADEEVFIVEAFVELLPDRVKAVLRRFVLGNKGRAVFNFTPMEGKAWRLSVVTVGIDSSALGAVVAAISKESDRGLVSTARYPLAEIGDVLDRAAPRLRDFEGKPERLREYLRAHFGHQVIRPRKSRNKPETNANGAAFLEPEEAADAISGLVVQAGSDTQIKKEGEVQMNTGNGNRDPQYAPDSLEYGDPAAPQKPPEAANDPGQPPDGWGPASMRAEMAVREGRPCPICGKPTERLGLYQLAGGRLVRISGNGPSEMDPRKVFDATGELRARAYDE